MASPIFTISLPDLLEALELGGSQVGFFADRETVELVMFTEDDAYEEGEVPPLIAARDNPERYFPIQPLPSRTAFSWMADFADLQRPTMKERLYGVLNRPKPFKAFKDTLLRLALLEEWYAYRDDRLKQYALAWAEEVGLTVTD